jgi:uncharacterized protein (DUF924 family)
MSTMTPPFDPILVFWLGGLDALGRADAEHQRRWFTKDDAFDREIVDRFGETTRDIREGRCDSWLADPRGRVAYVIALDQFPRNMFRGNARAFATDPLAREATRVILDNRWDKAMTPDERMFAYLPLEHSESLGDQERCLALMKEIAVFPATADLPKWAEAHLVIIRRFGRFPHRNAALGRASTPEEVEFLKQPGSSF